MLILHHVVGLARELTGRWGALTGCEGMPSDDSFTDWLSVDSCSLPSGNASLVGSESCLGNASDSIFRVFREHCDV